MFPMRTLFVLSRLYAVCIGIPDEVVGIEDVLSGLYDEDADTYDALASGHVEAVGFTAWTQSTQIYDPGDTIIFEGTEVNEGGYYDPSSGEFSCPYDAVYYVAVTNKKAAGAASFLEVVRGRDGFIYIDDAGIDNNYNILSNSALIDCRQGQSIFVRGYFPGGVIYGTQKQAHSTFTVVMMSRDDTLLHNGTFVGFSSYNMAVYDYGPGEVIPFSGEILSSPDYDAELSVFTCPITGVYYVVTHLQKYSAFDLYLGVSKGAAITLHSEDAYTENQWNTLSNSRLLYCQAGEVLAVTGLQAASVYGAYYFGYTTFSAILVYEEENLLYSSFVGFTMMKNSDQTYSAGDRISFEVPLQDDDNVYNTTMNAFVCPDSALYYVSVTFVRVGTAALDLAVVMGTGTPFYSKDSYTGNPGNTVTNGGLFHCLPEQQVFVAALGDGSVHGDPNKALTMFTIMKIFDY